MGRYTEKLAALQKEATKLYDPKTAIGNQELAKVMQQGEELSKKLETHDECSNCDGWAFIECGECGHERDCEYCEDGLIEKS
jgi:hypothetical protein